MKFNYEKCQYYEKVTDYNGNKKFYIYYCLHPKNKVYCEMINKKSINCDLLKGDE